MMANPVIKIGTRKSQLAMWQAHYVADRLKTAGANCEIIAIETKGDKVLDVSISKIGSKGVFTEELESRLEQGDIDIAVHSAKDLQSDLGDKLEIIAFTEREVPNDVLVSNKKINLSDMGTITVGTSSTRRVAVLKGHFPQINIVDMRGNLQTRIQKMNDGHCDAMILAYAGVHRMGMDHLIRERLSLKVFTPAVGQGSVAVEASINLNPSKKELIRKAVNHELSEECLRIERAFLKRMDGGCSIPVFGFAERSNKEIHFEAGIISLDGKKEIRVNHKMSVGNRTDFAIKTAEEVLHKGGGDILRQIKDTL